MYQVDDCHNPISGQVCIRYPGIGGWHWQGPNRRPNRRPNYACCRNYNQTVALFCGVNALGRFLPEEPSPPRCATSSVNLKLTHCFPTISLLGYLGRPPRGPPKRTLFETQREYLLLLPYSSQAPSKALLKRSYRGLPTYIL